MNSKQEKNRFQNCPKSFAKPHYGYNYLKKGGDSEHYLCRTLWTPFTFNSATVDTISFTSSYSLIFLMLLSTFSIPSLQVQIDKHIFGEDDSFFRLSQATSDLIGSDRSQVKVSYKGKKVANLTVKCPSSFIVFWCLSGNFSL